jgi:acyl transferase domain-containing protein
MKTCQCLFQIESETLGESAVWQVCSMRRARFSENLVTTRQTRTPLLPKRRFPRQRCISSFQTRTSVQNPVFVGNINAPRQIVIAGSNEGMDRALEEARRQGASKAVRLHVPVPSHCPLLQPVADLLGKRMSSVNLTTPRMTYIGCERASHAHQGDGCARSGNQHCARRPLARCDNSTQGIGV